MISVIVGWSAIGAWRMMTRDACRRPPGHSGRRGNPGGVPVLTRLPVGES